MSMNSRYRERKYNTSDNDRLIRALSQPVQAWDKKWTQHSNSKTLQTFKWVKSERVIEFEQDEESEEEPEPMETDQPIETVELQTSSATEQLNNEPAVTTATETTSTSIQPTAGAATAATTTTTTTTTTMTTESATGSIATTKTSEHSIPGGPSSLLNNKAISSLQQQEEDMEDDESRSQTPKLDDISDEEPDPTLDNDDDDDNDTDNMNDPSKHPALAPHAQAHMTDDDMMTDSTAATPQTEGNTPMPQLDDEDMEEQQQQSTTNNAPAHPLSQEILTGIMAQDDIASLNNDSPAIQTPEDISSVSHPHNPMGE